MALLGLSLAGAQAQDPTPTEALNLTPIGNVKIEEGIAEIVAYDPATQLLYTSNTENLVDIIDISDPTKPTSHSSIALSELGASPNSVDFYRYDDETGLLAVAIEADPKTEPGVVALFDQDGALVNTVEVGVLPDMLTFSPDGQKIIVANEGEPDASYQVDPEGSVSIIDLSEGAENATATMVDFRAYIGQEETLRAKGVRIFGPGANVAQDFEPEYIAVSPDGALAFVTLQENNAFAVIDLAEATVLDIMPLGLKDHSRGPLTLAQYEFTDLPDLGQTGGGQTIKFGGLSGLWFEGVDEASGNLKFVTVPDRGPNGEPTDVDGDGSDERPFVLPDYQAQVVRFELNPDSGQISLTETIFLTRQDGETPITGLPNMPEVDETPVDLEGNFLDYDPLGADLEGIVVAPNGDFWMVDEYRPAIYHFGPDGVLIDRFVPQGTAALAGAEAGAFGQETLPAVYSARRANRGFEGVALDTDNNILYAFIQSPLMNPDRATSDNSRVIRMLGIDPASGQPVAEYVYLLEKPAYFQSTVDKIGDAVYAGAGKFYVVERDSTVGPTSQKPLFLADINGATNLLAQKTPEQQTPDEMSQGAIRPVNKVKVANLPSLGYVAGDKIEGLAALPDGRLAILNDNDFGLLAEPIAVDGMAPLNPEPAPVVLGILSFAEGNQLDASDKDDEINLQNWPVYGMYLPDAIAAFSVAGATYYLTANEGDAREYLVEDEEGEVIAGYAEESRVADLALDPAYFPEAEMLQDEANLGRLKAALTGGNLDGDGEVEQIHVYGGRSFSIWDAYGNLVFDSGGQFEQFLATANPEGFNGQVDEEGNLLFDDRSDDKGAEPEGVVVGEIEGRIYAFVGLERDGGIMVYDVTTPTAPELVTYANSFEQFGDISPEGLKFIKAEDSPTGKPLLAVSYEVSGSVTLFEITVAE
jgi:hypothetical protein